MTRKLGWSKIVLIHQIDNQSYEKSLLGQTNFDQAITPELRARAKLAVKDEYTFDFLELADEHSERTLERSLISRIEDFLRAMGGMFAFVGSQFRLDVDGDEYVIDLLLFHRRLKALVALDLKIGKFQPEFVGKIRRRRSRSCWRVCEARSAPISPSSSSWCDVILLNVPTESVELRNASLMAARSMYRFSHVTDRRWGKIGPGP